MNIYYHEKLKPFLKSPYVSFLLVGIILIVLRFMVGVLPPDIYGAVVTTSYYYLAGLGFALLLGYGGLASLGTGAFVGIGAFGLHFMYRYMTLPLMASILIVLLISIVISILFGFVSLRISGMYLAIVTMGLSQIVIEVIKNIPQYASGTTGGFLSGGPRRPLAFLGYELSSDSAVIFTAVFVVLAMIVVHHLIHSPTGRALLAVKNSETAAQTMGINLLKYRLFAFVISGVYGTLAGVLAMMFVRNGNVSQVGLTFALNILAAVVIGGTKSIWGILIGTFVIFGLDLAVFQRFQLGNYSIIINGLLIILVVMYYPGGLIQLFTNLKYKISQGFKKIKRVKV